MRGWIAFTALVACSSPSPSPGLAGPTPAPCSDVNPYGVCYPDAGIDDFCFDGAKPFCLSSFYDPDGRSNVRIVHIVVAAVWSGPSSVETDFITGSNATGTNPSGVSWSKELAPGVVFVELLSDGVAVGTGATSSDLNAWIAAHDANIDIDLDPNLQKLGIYLDSAAIPANIDIDTRTMKIIDSSTGFDTNLDQTLKQLLASMK